MEQTDSGTDTDQEMTVMFVDDNPDQVMAYGAMLQGEYTVLTETSGSDALDRVDETVDVVFLDRRMPEMAGDEVLAELRQRGYSMPVAMLTAVDPDVDIVDMPFDDYLTKPITKDDLVVKVQVLSNRAAFDEASRKFYQLASKKAALEAKGVDPETDERYAQLIEQMEALRAELDEKLDSLFDEGSDVAFGDF